GSAVTALRARPDEWTRIPASGNFTRVPERILRYYDSDAKRRPRCIFGGAGSPRGSPSRAMSPALAMTGKTMDTLYDIASGQRMQEILSLCREWDEAHP